MESYLTSVCVLCGAVVYSERSESEFPTIRLSELDDASDDFAPLLLHLTGFVQDPFLSRNGDMFSPPRRLRKTRRHN